MPIPYRRIHYDEYPECCGYRMRGRARSGVYTFRCRECGRTRSIERKIDLSRIPQIPYVRRRRRHPVLCDCGQQMIAGSTPGAITYYYCSCGKSRKVSRSIDWAALRQRLKRRA